MWPAFFVLCYRCFCAFCAISLVGPYETTLSDLNRGFRQASNLSVWLMGI